jgi:hypothetical protein
MFNLFCRVSSPKGLGYWVVAVALEVGGVGVGLGCAWGKLGWINAAQGRAQRTVS